jgi:hypothetical protein
MRIEKGRASRDGGMWGRRPSQKRVNVLKKEVMTCRKMVEQGPPLIKIAEKISKAFALSLFNP